MKVQLTLFVCITVLVLESHAGLLSKLLPKPHLAQKACIPRVGGPACIRVCGANTETEDCVKFCQWHPMAHPCVAMRTTMKDQPEEEGDEEE